jgi:SlyX protein
MEKIHEERLVALESKLAHQDYLLDVLNQTVYRQQKQLDELDTLCAVLAKRVAELRTKQPDSTLPHEKPPHY